MVTKQQKKDQCESGQLYKEKGNQDYNQQNQANTQELNLQELSNHSLEHKWTQIMEHPNERNQRQASAKKKNKTNNYWIPRH